ncbi:MAG: exonuclease domain-containing protein [Bacteroidales bacterium]
MYAIIDVETTGLNPKAEKITEIAILLHDGNQVTDRFSTLINPEKKIPYRITQITGIDNKMVASAPKFYEIAKRIVLLTENRTIVGHNVSFDINFIKNEFCSLGYSYSKETICTIRKSRKLLPKQRSYSLGNLCENFHIQNKSQHRALGDAEATAKLFELLLDLEKNQDNIPTENDAPKSKHIIDTNHLPEKAGVYFFYNTEGKIIYIGKSINIKQRVLSHLSKNTDKKTLRMREQMNSVHYEKTGNEITALLYESFLIKKHLPVFNRAQRRTSYNWGLFSKYDKNGYLQLFIGNTKEYENIISQYSSQKAAKDHLFMICEKFELCQKLCNIYSSQGSCFHYQIKQCKGACIGIESPETYNIRVNNALQYYIFEVENFFIIEDTDKEHCCSVIHIENNIYKGYGYIDLSIETKFDAETLSDCIDSYPDTKDAKQIINSHLRKKNLQKRKLDSTHYLFLSKSLESNRYKAIFEFRNQLNLID